MLLFLSRLDECFNDWGGRGYDDSVPGDGTKIIPSGDRDYMIPCMVGKLAPNPIQFTRGLAK